ncbi:MAG: thermonuclease family protein [Alphaproteobacteria bacterium]|jgi:micrococcal nuclease
MILVLCARAQTVVDGDIVKLDRQRLRLANIDAPETDPARAKCAYERQLSQKSAAALVDRLDEGEPQIHRLGRVDRYQRPLVLISVNGKDVGQSLIEMRLAQPWVGRKVSWCN